MLKDLLRKSLLKDMKNVWTLKDEMTEKIETFFNSLEEDKIEDFMNIINILQDSTNEKMKVIEDSVAKLKPDVATGTLEQPEQTEQTETENEMKDNKHQKQENNNEQQNQKIQHVDDNKNPDEKDLKDNKPKTNKENVENEMKDYKAQLKDNDGQTSKENDEVMAMLLNN